MGEQQVYLSKLLDFLAAGLLSTFGGISAYLYTTFRKGESFKFTGFVINVVLAFFLGNVVGSFLPQTFEYRDGILMIAGFSTWPLLGIMEVYVEKFAIKFLDKKLGYVADDNQPKNEQ
ncbi:hypothetical protein [Ralstonia phage RSP15]|uniref:hypothetical protein n=1 Tax=Ralstonia phage RSP15 TaxID=1785960 RepID=UPI00074D2C73|nr:hypothetical protein BH754_gp006 [Ralstonia phage RSP15]BAU39964.1 hypothetical protein [Ralstonia phage RSP15]